MKKNFLTVFFYFFLCLLFISCTQKIEKQQEISFNPKDSVSVDALFDFYIESGIILPEMLKNPENLTSNHFHSYDCLIDDCEITHDYLQDSLSNYFFMELSCFSGSCGNNIYIICKENERFSILYNECGSIDSDLGPDTLVNNFKVIYYSTEGNHYKLFFDGKEFKSEEMSKKVHS